MKPETQQRLFDVLETFLARLDERRLNAYLDRLILELDHIARYCPNPETQKKAPGTPKTGDEYLATLSRPAVPEDKVVALALDADKLAPQLWDGPDRRLYRRQLERRLKAAQNDLTGFGWQNFTDEDRREFPELFEQYEPTGSGSEG